MQKMSYFLLFFPTHCKILHKKRVQKGLFFNLQKFGWKKSASITFENGISEMVIYNDVMQHFKIELV